MCEFGTVRYITLKAFSSVLSSLDPLEPCPIYYVVGDRSNRTENIFSIREHNLNEKEL